jgi:hypothetical protein
MMAICVTASVRASNPTYVTMFFTYVAVDLIAMGLVTSF